MKTKNVAHWVFPFSSFLTWASVEDQFQYDFLMAVIKARLGGRYTTEKDGGVTWDVRIGKKGDKLGRKTRIGGTLNGITGYSRYIKRVYLK